jgi:hypothetical protein
MTPKASLFLATYLEMWSIAEAAKRSGVSRAAHYKRLERDPRYREAFEDLQETIRDTIRDEIRRRAIDGWDEPVIYRGKKCDTIRKYSDRLLILLAKAHCPEFRDHVQMQHADDVNIRVEYVDVPANDEAVRH